MLRRLPLQYSHWVGFAAVLVIGIGAAVSAWGFGGNGYSPLRNAVSDLGDPRDSPLHAIFNYCLIIGSLLMACFITFVGILCADRSLYLVSAMGVLGNLALVWVGVFPAAPETMLPHLVAAAFAFLGFFALGLSFSVYMLTSRRPLWPKWMLAPALLTTLCAFLFMLAIVLTQLQVVDRSAFRFGQTPWGRPYLNLVMVLEWSVLFSTLGWSLMTAWVLRRQGLMPRAYES